MRPHVFFLKQKVFKNRESLLNFASNPQQSLYSKLGGKKAKEIREEKTKCN